MNIDGNALYQYGQGGAIAIIAIVMVFAVLLLIIVLTELVTKLAGKDTPEVAVATNNNARVEYATSKLNENDEDATVACLVASIDYRNETGKHIQVLNVREVK